MADPSYAREEVRELTWAWWLLMLVGLVSVAAGVVILAKPGNSLKALAVIAGVFILLDGIFEVVASLSRRTQSRGTVALLGVLSVIVGVILIRHPIAGVAAVALLIGVWLVAVGVLRVVAAFESPHHRLWNLLVAAVEVIAGIVIVSSPDIGFATLAILTGIAFIMNGLTVFALGWTMRTVRHDAAQVHAARPAM